MRPYVLLIAMVILCLAGTALAQDTPDDTLGLPDVLAGDYLGFTTPGTNPEPFGRGVLSSDVMAPASAPAFSPDGNELFFSVTDRRNARRPRTIMYMRQKDGKWTPPAIASFSGDYEDATPVFSPDGSRMYFASRRPLAGSEPQPFFDLWYLERTDDGWSEPKPVGAPVNTSLNEYGPVVVADGSLYYVATTISGAVVGFYAVTVLIVLLMLAVLIFKRLRKLYLALGLIGIWVLVAIAIMMSRGPRGFLIHTNDDIYYSKFTNGSFSAPVPLGDEVNGVFEENWHWVDPDESWLLFYSRDMQQGRAYYVSFRNDDGSWSERRRAGDFLNRAGTRPALSPDGLYLFWVTRDGYTWMQSGIVEYLRTHDLNLLDRFLETVESEGGDAAIEQYLRERDEHAAYNMAVESQVNSLGYDYMRNRRDTETARALFKLNTVLFPESFNVWDSYAEVCVEEGDIDEAIQNYRKSLRINPENENAVDYLRQLGIDVDVEPATSN